MSIAKIRMKNITRSSGRFPQTPSAPSGHLNYSPIVHNKYRHIKHYVVLCEVDHVHILSGDLQNDPQTHNGESASEKTGIPSQSRRATTNSAGGIANSS